MTKENKDKLFGWLLVSPGMCLLISLVMIPVVMLFIASLTEGNEILGSFTLEYYQYIFTDGIFLKLMLRSIWIGILVTFLSIVIGYPVAYCLAHVCSEKARSILSVVIIIPFFTSQLLLIYSMMNLLGSNSPVMNFIRIFGIKPPDIMYTSKAVVIVLIYNYLVYVIQCLFASISKIDANKLYAARTMGAGAVRRFVTIIFPLSIPGILSSVQLVFLPVAGSFVQANLTGGSNGMMVGSLINSNFTVNYNLGRGAAMSIVFLIILIFVNALINFVLKAIGKRV